MNWGARSEGEECVWTDNYNKMRGGSVRMNKEIQGHGKHPNSARWIPDERLPCFLGSLSAHKVKHPLLISSLTRGSWSMARALGCRSGTLLASFSLNQRHIPADTGTGRQLPLCVMRVRNVSAFTVSSFSMNLTCCLLMFWIKLSLITLRMGHGFSFDFQALAFKLDGSMFLGLF